MKPVVGAEIDLAGYSSSALEDLGREAFAKVGFLGRQRVVGVPDTDGLGPDRQVVVRGGLLGFCERPVEGGGGRGLARVLPGLDGELLRDVRDGTPLSFSARAQVSESSSTFGRPPWLPLAAPMTWPSRVFSRM
jgi:hypothetical protein